MVSNSGTTSYFGQTEPKIVAPPKLYWIWQIWRLCVCVALNRDLRDSWRYKDVLKVFGWSNLSGRFSLLFVRASAEQWSLLADKPAPPSRDYLAACRRCERLNSSPTLFWRALLQVLHLTPEPPLWKKLTAKWNHSFSGLMSSKNCHNCAGLASLVCDWQRQQRWARCMERKEDRWRLPVACVNSLGCAVEEGVQDHFPLSARKAIGDKTRLDVVEPGRLMIDSEMQQQRLRILQSTVWECSYVRAWGIQREGRLSNCTKQKRPNLLSKSTS